ncbi:MAG TPA: tRNA glutamyl-Q(34) synthetase GluQRS [Rhodospirillaceae bacterium]|nr:MAG: tRNA glutamyl-Q(34) synthetase GluQRS [Alphaproteobacteria bacterium GWF2_58_20]HAU29252.1 tRNA glutamyl-Q(34) synthetase GluQRS [Rhodospirillaceae bacterium]
MTVSHLTTRFAPSPTGWLHLGHAHSALTAFRTAQDLNGQFLLRMENIDPSRCRPEYEAAIFEDLAWLGLSWESPVRRQSEHAPYYAAGLARLSALGVLYPCFCTRRDIATEISRMGFAPHAGETLPYPGTCRNVPPEDAAQRMADGQPYALRINVARALSITGPLSWLDAQAGPQKAMPARLGDAILARKDVPMSYHLCVTMDDALQGVTHIIRGHDLFEATHLHRLLQALLGYDAPQYRHHPLLCNENGQKLSKRDGAITIRDLRAQGLCPADVRARAGIADR